MFKHESDEVCADRGVETCQTLKNARVRDFDLPIGAISVNEHDRCFYFVQTCSNLGLTYFEASYLQTYFQCVCGKSICTSDVDWQNAYLWE